MLIRSIDRPELLQKALSSVAAQTWPAIEVVVVSANPNHSPLPNLCGTYPLRFIPTPTPLARSHAANRGLHEARGDYILFLDDDDWLAPDHIKKLAEALNENPHSVAAYSDVQRVDEGGSPLPQSPTPPFDPLRLLSANWISVHTVLFRRTMVAQGCQFDEALDHYEDWDFWLQLLQQGSFVHAPGPSAYYRIHGSSGVHELEAFYSNAALNIYRKWRARWSDAQLSAMMMRVWRMPELLVELDELNQLRAIERAHLNHERLALIRTQNQIKTLQAGVTAHEARIHDLLHSSSWRITAPMRAMARAARLTHKALRVLWRAITQPRWGLWALQHSVSTLTTRGWAGFAEDLNRQIKVVAPLTYLDWLERYEIPVSEYARLQQMANNWDRNPVISVIMPTYNSNLLWLQEAIDSVRNQIYPHWELCIADDASHSPELHALLDQYAAKDARIRWVKRETNGHISAASNNALALANGEFVALLDHDDKLHPLALWFMAEAICTHPDAGLIYSDEDKLDEEGHRCTPHFKCDYNPELMLAQNIVSHLGCFRRKLVLDVNGFRKGFEGAQDYDLALRIIERLQPHQIIHIPRLLYHWRISPGSTAQHTDAKNYAPAAALRAINEHLNRVGIKGRATSCAEAPHLQRVHFECPNPLPKVTIIIPTRDHAELLKTCVDSVFQKTTYSNFEIIVVDNGSVESATHELFIKLQEQGVIIHRDERPFNYAALNNAAAKMARGELLCLMNNDIEIITPGWLEEMVSFATQPGVGAVGARLWYPNNTLQHGGVVVGLGGVAGHAFVHQARDLPGYFWRAVLHQSYSAITAACLVIRKSIFDEVKGLDETLAVAFNDVDFCLRVRAAGYRNVWTPYAEMIHHESISRGFEDTPAKKKRFMSEAAILKERWPHVIADDPAYSPNLSLDNGNFELAHPPRVRSPI